MVPNRDEGVILLYRMLVKHTTTRAAQSKSVRLRCPQCRQIGTFCPITDDYMMAVAEANTAQGIMNDDLCFVGHRICPNETCSLHVFVVIKNDRAVASYPPERIDFDTSEIPKPVSGALEEGIACLANECFKASAMMVRKCLEEMCNERGATGANLQQRIKSLKDKVILPTDLFDGLDELRLLGNDAAHVESREYDTVGREEVVLAIDFTKEVLKSVYQYASLRQRLQALKRKPTA